MRCGWCRGRNHNATTCKKKANFIKENPDSYTARSEMAKRGYKKPRCCSFCHEPGHNRRNCESKEKLEKLFTKTCNKYRRSVSDKLIEMGIGVGSLVETSVYGFDLDKGEDDYFKTLCMVTGISFYTHEATSTIPRITLEPVRNMVISRRNHIKPSPTRNIRDFFARPEFRTYCKVVSGLTNNVCKRQYENIEIEEKVVKRIFSETEVDVYSIHGAIDMLNERVIRITENKM